MAQTKIRQAQTVNDSVAVPYGSVAYGNPSGNWSTNSTSYAQIDATNLKVTLNLRYGKLVMVDLVVEGVWTSNTGYGAYFDIGIGGATTRSTSGEKYTSYAGWAANWATDGASRAIFVGKFYFVDTGTGSKDFYPLFRVSNVAATAYIGQYAIIKMAVTELYMQ